MEEIFLYTYWQEQLDCTSFGFQFGIQLFSLLLQDVQLVLNPIGDQFAFELVVRLQVCIASDDVAQVDRVTNVDEHKVAELRSGKLDTK